MPPPGRLELLSTVCALGWAQMHGDAPAYVQATLGDDIIGVARADLTRPDLTRLAEEGALHARAFAIVFDREIPPDDVARIEIRALGNPVPLPKAGRFAIDRFPRLRIFVLGSPRSGTSELGDTLARVLKLPWLGEGHAAPLFATAAEAMAGNPDSPNGFVRFLANQDVRGIPMRAMQAAFYAIHGSSSFLDKTPGIPMIKAAPFVAECFPDARFIYLRRNGISNVLSRMSKFGGNFTSHCQDWAGAMNAWATIKDRLPHFLELRQEDMLTQPEAVGERLATYLGEPAATAAAIGGSLRSGTRERTGAGIGRDSLAETGWSNEQCDIFRRVCGPTMQLFGYDSF